MTYGSLQYELYLYSIWVQWENMNMKELKIASFLGNVDVSISWILPNMHF